jgi:hypothetical protein
MSPSRDSPLRSHAEEFLARNAAQAKYYQSLAAAVGVERMRRDLVASKRRLRRRLSIGQRLVRWIALRLRRPMHKPVAAKPASSIIEGVVISVAVAPASVGRSHEQASSVIVIDEQARKEDERDIFGHTRPDWFDGSK